MALLYDFKIQEGAKTWAPVYHKPFEQFSPSYQLDYSYAPNVQISSPGATGSTITTKKEATQTPYIGGQDIQAGTGDVSGPDFMGPILGLAIIGALAWMGSSLIKRKK